MVRKCECESQRNVAFEYIKKSSVAKNVSGGEGWGRSLAWSLIYSIVRKRQKENPDQVNGGYYCSKSSSKMVETALTC